MPIMNI